MMAQTIMKAVREKIPTNANFFSSRILAFQTMFPGITITRGDELSAWSYSNVPWWTTLVMLKYFGQAI